MTGHYQSSWFIPWLVMIHHGLIPWLMMHYWFTCGFWCLIMINYWLINFDDSWWLMIDKLRINMNECLRMAHALMLVENSRWYAVACKHPREKEKHRPVHSSVHVFHHRFWWLAAFIWVHQRIRTVALQIVKNRALLMDWRWVDGLLINRQLLLIIASIITIKITN